MDLFRSDSDEAAVLKVLCLEALGLPYYVGFRELDGALVEVVVVERPPEDLKE